MNATEDDPFLEPDHPRLAQQLRFIYEVDRLKTILRRTLLIDESRLENSAEHFLASGSDGDRTAGACQRTGRPGQGSFACS